MVLDRRGLDRVCHALYFAGTAYLAVTLIGISTYHAHVVATTFLLLAIHEALGKRRLLLVGLFLGLAAACRFTEIFALPFFTLMAAAVDRAVRDGAHVGSFTCKGGRKCDDGAPFDVMVARRSRRPGSHGQELSQSRSFPNIKLMAWRHEGNS